MYITEFIKQIAPFIYNKHRESVSGSFNIILYGAAEKGKQLLKKCKEYGIQVICFCDDDDEKWGKAIDGIKIVSPEELNNRYNSVPVFISSKWSDGISEKLRRAGHKYIYHRFAIDYLFHMAKLQEVYDVLSDELSKSVFKGLIEYVFTQQPDVFKRITYSEEQYFLNDIFKFKDDESIVDGGAFIGDTTQRYNEISRGQFKKIYCFEPDSENFKKLSQNIINIADYQNRIEIYNLGLYSGKGKLYFNNSHSSASCIVDYAKYSIPVSSVDEIIQTEPVTMIKLDIEGAEVAALKGARRIIQGQKPKLAICNYHLPTDIWEVPLKIKELAPGYKLYLRHHNYNCWYESVIYAKID